MPRPSAADRVTRILAIVPWIAERDAPTIEEICSRFSVSRKELIADLDVVLLVGVHPYTPDAYIEVVIDEDDRVSIDYGNHFERPLRLSKHEALAVLAAGKAAAGQDGHDPDGPLARGLDKLAAVVGIDLDEDLDVRLAELPRATREPIEIAIEQRRVLHVGYFSHGRAEHTDRIIEPQRLYSAEGAWYVAAHCRTSDGQRIFRADRFTALEVGDERFEPREAPKSTAAFEPDDDLPRVTIEVDVEGAWAAQQYPVESRSVLDDGRQRLTFAVSATPWLERLLLRLGPHGRVVEGSDDHLTAGREAARRLLERYAT